MVLLCWLLGVTLEGTDALGTALFVSLLVAEEAWNWGRLGSPNNRPLARIALEPLSAHDRPSAPSLLERLADDAPTIADSELDESVSQQLTRRREADGQVIEGWTRVELLTGERHAAAHVAICPPLPCVPQCFAEQMDGPPARLKIAQVLAYGVRFEIKLDEPAAEPTSAVIEFSLRERHLDDAVE